MVTSEVVAIIMNYLEFLKKDGMPVAFGVLFGSQARGGATPDSDFDLVVVSPLFDNAEHWSDTERLWTATVYTDSRIEPIGVGVRQWEEDDRLPIIEIARREGQIIYPHQ
ncbi:MAG: nucleotidyltransferase domain-containing protein [Magnetococcales bacterium]|nr:nucleotidyltransferase domain-containing protein [Magnetococcales bacterium]